MVFGGKVDIAIEEEDSSDSDSEDAAAGKNQDAGKNEGAGANAAGEAKALSLEGVALGQKSDYTGAIVAFSKALKLDPKNADAKKGLELATAAFKQKTQKDPDALSNLGVTLGNQGNHDGAIAAFKRALTIDPSHTQALTNLAGAFNGVGRYKDAAHVSEKAIAENPKNAGAHHNLGTALGNQRDYAGAAAAFQAAVDIDPENVHAQKGLKVAKEKAALVAGSELRPEPLVLSLTESISAAETAKAKGTVLFKEKKYAGALLQYERAFKAVTDAHLGGGDLQTAEEEEMVKSAEVLMQSCALNSAMCALKLKKYDQCVRFATSVLKSLEMCPQPNANSNVKALFRRGSAYLELNEWGKAKDDLCKARDLAGATPGVTGGKEVIKALRLLKQRKQDAKAKEKAAFGGGFAKGGLFDATCESTETEKEKEEKDKAVDLGPRANFTKAAAEAGQQIKWVEEEDTAVAKSLADTEAVEAALTGAGYVHDGMSMALSHLSEHKTEPAVVALAAKAGIDLAVT